MAKKKTIDCTKAAYSNIDEIDGIIRTLCVFDLIDACDYIRKNGVIVYDYDRNEEKVVPLDMNKIHAVTGAPEYASLESVCADWFGKLLGGVKNNQGYKDFVYWYNTHDAVLKACVDAGETPEVPYSEIKYVALQDTLNSMCEELMAKYDEDLAETEGTKN